MEKLKEKIKMATKYKNETIKKDDQKDNEYKEFSKSQIISKPKKKEKLGLCA